MAPAASRWLIAEPFILFHPLLKPSLAGGLRRALAVENDKADLVRIPVIKPPSDPSAVDELLAWRMLDVGMSNNEPIHALVSLGYPAYFLRHPRHVAWLLLPPCWLDAELWQQAFPGEMFGAEPNPAELALLAAVRCILPVDEAMATKLKAVGLSNVAEPMPAPAPAGDYAGPARRLRRYLSA